MRSLRRPSFALGLVAAAVLLSAFVPAAARRAADVTGTWSLSVSTPNGDVGVTAVLKQAGDSVSGTIASDVGGTQEVRGVVTADTVRMGFNADMQGQVIPISVVGVVSDKDNMAGTFEVGGMGGFPFAGRRQSQTW